jgi:hypothetical protein
MADPSQSAAAAAELRLTCRPGKTGNVLTFPYTLENRGPADIYAMDALPTVDRADGEPRADEQAAVVVLAPDGDAILGKFAAALPTDRRIAVPILPLARHVPAGTSFEGQLEIPLPLAETSPYFAELTLRQYEVVDIKGVVFTVGYWLAGVDGLVATPADYVPELFVIATRNTLRSALRVSRRFPTTGLQLFKRTDQFPR